MLKFFFFLSYFVLQIREAPGPSSCDYSDGSWNDWEGGRFGAHRRAYVCVYLRPSLYTHTFTPEDKLILVHTWRVLQLMKINLRIRWINLTLLGPGARGEKYVTDGQFSTWSSRVKKVCKKKKKKLSRFKPQKYLCSLKKELSEKVAGGEVCCRAAQAASCSGLCTLFSSVFGNLDRLQNSGLRSNSGCVWLQESKVRYDGTNLNDELVPLPFSVNCVLEVLIYYFPFPFPYL